VFWLIKTAIVGLIIGALARFVMPGKNPAGIWMTMLLGIAGSMFGTLIGKMLGMYDTGEAAGWIMSTIGAVIILWGFGKWRSSQVRAG